MNDLLARENARIAALPRRRWQDRADADAAKWTARLKTPNGTQTLRPIQAAAIAEAVELGGVFVHGRVGVGKFLMSVLIGVALGCTRIMVLVPGKMKKSTYGAIREARQHWKIPANIRVVSYSFLGGPDKESWLEDNPADALICDEAQALKDIENASVARRVGRYRCNHPEIYFSELSGTLSPSGKLEHYGHSMVWCLRGHSPVPLTPEGRKPWSQALEGSGDTRALLGAKTPNEVKKLFKERLASSPGVIISEDTYDGVPLEIHHSFHEPGDALEEPFEKLRTLWEADDGWSFEPEAGGGFGVSALARQYSQGFYYRHDPRPPEWFLKKRKTWTNHCHQLREDDVVDSPGQIVVNIRRADEALERAEEPWEVDEAERAVRRWAESKEVYLEWKAAEAEFPMNRVEEWFTLEPILYAKKWAERVGERGIIWVSHVEVGIGLERLTGLPFFHGQDERDILEENGSRVVIASIQANGTGKNLQYAFCHNLVLCCPGNGEAQEQMIGRTHREGQVRTVTVEYAHFCRESVNAWNKSVDDAREITATLSPQKLAKEEHLTQLDSDHFAWREAEKLQESA